jgi:hypothetical protein
MKGMKSLFLLILIAVIVGCVSSRVTLVAPAANAPFETRRAAYEQLAPVGMDERITMGVHGSSNSLRLGNGEEVWDPEDLLPVVDPNSRTARAIRQSIEYRHQRQTRKADNAGKRAFRAYELDLRARLGVCVDGDFITDCAGAK